MANLSTSSDVVKLASLVSDAKTEEIPRHLLEIGSILQRHPQHSKEARAIKRELLEYDLLSWCSTVLQYDFMKVKGGYETAVSITKILFDSCTGLNLGDSQEFSKVTLPAALQNAMRIAWRIQQDIVENAKYVRSIKYGARAEALAGLKTNYQATLDAIVNVMTSHPYLVDSVLKSDNLIRLLVEEDEHADESITAALVMLLRGVRVGQLAIKNMAASTRGDILNELIYKVTTSQCDDLAAVTIKIILAMIDADPDIASKMSVRFKGLKVLLTRWMGHGFDPPLQRLIEILDAGNAQIAELARRTRAVRTIWAGYQGWKTRARVKKLHKAVPSLQSSFRRKRQEKMEEAFSRRLHLERERNNELTRKRSMRSTHEKQLHMLEIVPARKVHSHIQSEEAKAAVAIQSRWRGSTQRKKFTKHKHLTQAARAAIVIQRAVRRFLARREKRMKSKERTDYLFRTKLTKERREELEMAIKQRQLVRGVKETSVQEAKSIHDTTQEALLSHHRRRIRRNQLEQMKVTALLAKIHTEQEILHNIPHLQDASWEDVKNLACSSTAVAMAAEKEHSRMMKDLTSSWWQKLSLKPGENLNPFDDKGNLKFNSDIDEVEEFLNPRLDRDVLF